MRMMALALACALCSPVAAEGLRIVANGMVLEVDGTIVGPARLRDAQGLDLLYVPKGSCLGPTDVIDRLAECRRDQTLPQDRP